jgi:glycogen operon protein
MAILFLSLGVPMIRSGDEVYGTQRGNNNVYCQNNELSWFNWELTQEHGDMLRFVTGLIAFRKRHPCLMRRTFLTGKPRGGPLPDVTWHGRRLNEPPWEDSAARILAYTFAGLTDAEENLHIMLNMSGQAVEMELPKVPGLRWYRAVDTSQLPPSDICEIACQPLVREGRCRVAARSVVVLESRTAP